jgi:AcrR family transcriptional regulator
MKSHDTLTPRDWIAAGFRALTVGGPQAIKIEAIARELRVSKGSFYWHFKDVASFKLAMLSHWAEVATKDVISKIGGSKAEPREQLRHLVQVAAGNSSDPYGGKQVEAAIRDWARYDADVAETIKAVDHQRLQFLTMLLRASGMSSTQASTFACILYGALIGLEQLSYHKLANVEGDLSALLDILLSTSYH